LFLAADEQSALHISYRVVRRSACGPLKKWDADLRDWATWDRVNHYV